MLRYLKSAPSVEPLTDPHLIDTTYRYWRWRILYSMYVGYALFYFTRKSFTFIIPPLQADLHFDKAEIGILSSVFYIMYGVSKFISGMISDKSNPQYFMAVGLIMTGIANILFGLSSSLVFLTIFWLFNGFFQGWGWPPCARLLTHWYSQRERGVWWGIWNTSHNVGGALIPLLIAIFAVRWGWRVGMFISGSIAIVIGLILIDRLRDVPTSLGLPCIEEYKNDYPSEKKAFVKTDISVKDILCKFVLTNWYIWLLAFSYVSVYIVRTAINDWGAVYLKEMGYSLVSANSCVSFFEIGGFFGSLFAGWMSDKIFKGKRGPVNILFSIGLTLSTLAFWFYHGHAYFVHAFCLFWIGFLVFGPQMMIGIAAAELSHREAAGTATGFVGLFGYLGAAISGYPVGLIMKHYQWDGFFVAITVCGLISVLLLLPLWSVKINKKMLEEEPSGA